MSAREIAKGLTKPQREQVLRGTVGGDFAMVTVRALIRKGVMHIVPDSPNGRCGPCVLTKPLGEEVRAILKEPPQ